MILCSVTVTETDVQVMEHLPRRLHTVEYWNLFFCEQVSLSHYDARLRYSLYVHQSSLIYLTQSSLESCRISSGSSHIITASGEELPVHLLGRQKHASLFPCYTINSMHAPPFFSGYEAGKRMCVWRTATSFILPRESESKITTSPLSDTDLESSLLEVGTRLSPKKSPRMTTGLS